MDLKGMLLEPSITVLAKWKKPDNQKQNFKPKSPESSLLTRMISVVIPAHNEENYLDATLASLRRQNYPWFEIIVVANGCTDHTAQVARDQCHRLIVLSQKSLGVARNFGARMAKG